MFRKGDLVLVDNEIATIITIDEQDDIFPYAVEYGKTRKWVLLSEIKAICKGIKFRYLQKWYKVV